jgi:hypothetical protein
VELPQGTVIQPSQVSEGPGVVRVRYTGINLLSAQSFRAGDTLTLILFEDAVYTFAADLTEQQGEFVTTTGHILEVEDSLAVMTVSGEQIMMDILMGVETYQVRYRGEGVYAIYQVDQAAFPQELPPVEVNPEMLAGEQPGGEAGPQPAPQAAGDDGSQIDVLVVYTQAAREEHGGATQIQLLINNAIAVTNQTYATAM